MFKLVSRRQDQSPVSNTTATAEVTLQRELDLYKKAFAEIQKVVEAAGKGDLTVRVTHWDEFLHLSPTLAALNQSLDLADAYVRESGAALEAALNKEYHRIFLEQGIPGDYGRGAQVINNAAGAMAAADKKRSDDLHQLAGQFEDQVLNAISNVATIVDQTGEQADRLMDDARSNEEQASSVAAAAEQATVNVQTVAAATEELTASVEAVNQQIGVSTQRVGEAENSTNQTTEIINELGAASAKIGDVVNLINDIADQTNLLALNATIEAARAGDAGKGFAVVASEVKSLAQQTSSATDDIGQQINNIQSKTETSVAAVKDIGEAIVVLTDVSQSIASATTEQSNATLEISRNVQEASQGTSEVSQSILQVSNIASQTLKRATELQTAANDMQEQMAVLREQSQQFIASIRAF